MQFPTVAERYLSIEGCANLRDIGGYPTANGNVTRTGVLFRGDSLHNLPPAGQQALLCYGVRTIIDLRHPTEAARAPHVFATVAGVQYLHLPLIDDEASRTLSNRTQALHVLYCLLLDGCQPQFRAVLQAIAIAPAPLVVHCTAGKDRTGLVIALILGLAGVPAITIAADYAVSSRCLSPVLERLQQQAVLAGLKLPRDAWLLEARPETMLRTLAYLDSRYGGIQGYVRRIGVAQADVDRIKALIVA